MARISRSRSLADRYGIGPEEMMDETVYTALRREEAKPKIELILDQEHRTTNGKVVVSHLIAIPKGTAISEDLKAVFSFDIAGRRCDRGPWHQISDKGITSQYPQHSVYWLCRDTTRSAKWVTGVVGAILAPNEEPVELRPIKNKVMFD